jgi:very-short-patch-repair endonuclease
MAIEHIRDVLRRIPAILMGRYESPAEECLGERLRTAVSPATSFQTQVWVDTTVGSFRLDILLTDKNGRRIAVEVDGKEFHEPVRDHWRTVFVVGEGRADVVYRVPACDLKINLVGVLAGLGALEPQCFNPSELLRWREIVSSIYSNHGDDESDGDEGEECDEGRSWSDFWAGSNIAIENHFRSNARECGSAAIKAYYDFAIATGLKDLETIQKAWESARPLKPFANVPPDPFEFFKSF